MKPKTIYLVLCGLGALLPYWQFLPWLIENRGLHMHLFWRDLFASRISAFAWMDVFVSAAALLAFMSVERTRVRISARWLPVVCLLMVGVSLALPLYLYLRESRWSSAAC